MIDHVRHVPTVDLRFRVPMMWPRHGAESSARQARRSSRLKPLPAETLLRGPDFFGGALRASAEPADCAQFEVVKQEECDGTNLAFLCSLVHIFFAAFVLEMFSVDNGHVSGSSATRRAAAHISFPFWASQSIRNRSIHGSVRGAMDGADALPAALMLEWVWAVTY